MTLKLYFEGRLRAAEQDLECAITSGFRLYEHTTAGGREITDEHIALLRTIVAEYQRVLASFNE